MNTYFIKHLGNIAGPFPVEAFIATMLEPDDLVLRNGDTKWNKASEYDDLAPFIKTSLPNSVNSDRNQYYYLEGLNKMGPHTTEELKGKNLTPDSLIYTDGMEKWTPVKDLHYINKILFDVTNEREIVNKVSNQSHNTNKIKIPAGIFLFIGIAISIGLSYFIVLNQREKDFKNIENKIDRIFQGKDEICDYKNSGVRGTLHTNGDGGGILNLLLEKDNEGKELVQYYNCTSGGFTVLTLTKKNNGFDLVESNSNNMGYKIPESRWTAGKDYGYGINTPGYSTPTFRESVQAAYDGAMKYISSEKENKSYVAGSYDKINTFDEIRTPFYYIGNIEPTKYSSTSTNSKSWKSLGNGAVFNNQWIVWYTYSGRHYEIIEEYSIFNKRWLIYSLIGSILAALLYILIRYRRNIAFQIT